MIATRLRTLLASILCISLLSGCVGSAHPLYTEGETVFREDLLGEYEVQFQDGPPTIWKVESIDDEAYRVTIPPGSVEDVDSFVMHLVELDGQLYLDLCPESGEAEAVTMPPQHIIASLRFEEEVPISANIDKEWLESYLAEHPDELSVERMEGKMLLITAETEELQQFIISHSDEGIFVNDGGEFGWFRHDP